MNKKTVIMTGMALVATMAFAAPKGKMASSAIDNEDTAGMSEREKKNINVLSKLELPKPGRNNSTAVAPSITGQSFVQCNQKERRWILLEAKYANLVRQERLIFTWHVLLDMQTADKDVRGKWDDPKLPNPPSRYSYFTTSVTYENIPSSKTVSEHASSVCLQPSYLECFGEPKVIALEVHNAAGELMRGGFGIESEVEGIKTFTPRYDDPKAEAAAYERAFWKDPKIMERENPKTKVKLVARREGLQERSQTIWALVKPNFFEKVVQ